MSPHAPILDVMYVDDQEDIRMIVEFALDEESGFRLILCASGGEALDRLAVTRPDVILLDVMMPGLDGPGTLERLRALPGHAETPVIFITAKVQSHEVSQLMALGAVAVIAKPFNPMLLPDQIREIWCDVR